MLGGRQGGGRDRVHPQDSGRRGRQTAGRRPVVEERRERTERPPSVGDAGDTQTNLKSARLKETEQLRDWLTAVLEYIYLG